MTNRAEGPTPPEPRASEGGAGAPPRPEASNVAPEQTREYRAPAITVQWYAGRCIHSANCVRALRDVFDPQRRPWIDPAAASADAIAAAVLRCPTGALHFIRHDGGPQEGADVPATATPIRGGPLYLRGDIEVRGLDGAPLRRDVRMSLCRCGLAAKMPFCDNACRRAQWQEAGSGALSGGAESSPPSSDGG